MRSEKYIFSDPLQSQKIVNVSDDVTIECIFSEGFLINFVDTCKVSTKVFELIRSYKNVYTKKEGGEGG